MENRDHQVTLKILRLFKKDKGQNRDEGERRCICGALISKSAVKFGEERVNVLLQALLVENEADTTGRSNVLICERCSSSFGSLVDLFLDLEVLRQEFNELRRLVGHKVIVGSLEESEEVYEGWLEKVQSVEDGFPVFGGTKDHQRTSTVPEVGGAEENMEEDPLMIKEEIFIEEEPVEFCTFPVDLLETTRTIKASEDPKLSSMPGVVMLRKWGESSGLSGRNDKTDQPSFTVNKLGLSDLDEKGAIGGNAGQCGELISDATGMTSTNDLMNSGTLRRVSKPRQAVSETSGTADNIAEEDEAEYLCLSEDTSSSAGVGDGFSGSCGLWKRIPRIPGEDGRSDPDWQNKCPVCDKLFYSRDNMKRHMRNIHPGSVESVRYVCPSCGKVYETIEELKEHKTAVHSGKNERKCVVCEKIFSSPDNLRRHMRNLHPEQVEHFCGICGDVFQTFEDLRGHKRTLHLYGKETKFKCEVCGKCYNNKSNLNLHKRTIHGESQDKV